MEKPVILSDQLAQKAKDGKVSMRQLLVPMASVTKTESTGTATTVKKEREGKVRMQRLSTVPTASVPATATTVKTIHADSSEKSLPTTTQ